MVWRSEVRRERLVLRHDGNRLFAANGFGTALRNLRLCVHDGNWWQADYLAAGDEVELQRVNPPELYRRALDQVRDHYWYFASRLSYRRQAVTEWVDPTLGRQYNPTVPPHWRNGTMPSLPPPNSADRSAKPPSKPTVPFCPGELADWFLLGGTREPWFAALLGDLRPDQLLCPGRYLAELEKSQFLPHGLRWVKEEKDRCWVLGIFEPPR